MVIEIILIGLSAINLLVVGYALRQINVVASNAFMYIKAGSLEEKIQGDSLNRTLKKIEEIAPPQLKELPKNPKDSEFAEQVVKRGTLKDGHGNEWNFV